MEPFPVIVRARVRSSDMALAQELVACRGCVLDVHGPVADVAADDGAVALGLLDLPVPNSRKKGKSGIMEADYVLFLSQEGWRWSMQPRGRRAGAFG